jgi:hypothetical protein
MPAGWGIDAGAALHFEGTAPRTLLKVPSTLGAAFCSPAGESQLNLAEFLLPVG